jgi:hypothetical protein
MGEDGKDNSIPKKTDEVGVLPIELAMDVPRPQPLAVDEIFKLQKARLGLRNTMPTKLAGELQDGTTGDYLVLSDLTGFLKPKDPKLDKAVHVLIQGGMVEALDGVDELPDNYGAALGAFFKDALTFRAGDLATERPDMSLGQYLEEMKLNAPAYLLVQGSRKSVALGYDKDKYYGFGKNGKAKLGPEVMVAGTYLRPEDLDKLKKVYSDYIDRPVNSKMDGVSMSIRDIANNEILELTRGKVLEMIRRKLETEE